MNVQRHYDDERLIELLESGRDARPDAHMAACSSCSESLESYRAITGVLREPSAWAAEPQPTSDPTLASLRTIAAAMQSEESAAAAMLEEIVALPRPWWAKKVAAEARFQTAALARALTAKSEAAIDAMPPDAVELSRAAIIAADAAGDAQTRGAAYRQYAYALFYTGDIPASLQAIDRSAEALDGSASSDYEIARLDIVRTVVFTALERYEEAIGAARRAEAAFAAYGDNQRTASALSAHAYALLNQLRYPEALAILQKIKAGYFSVLDPDGRARLIANIALCQWQTGDIAAALQSYEKSAVLLENQGTLTEAARVRLSIAGILAAEGQYSAAKARLRQLREQFGQHGMPFEMVFAGVVLSEILLAEGQYEEVESLCRGAIQVFENSGHAHRSQVLTAIGYLQEASALRRATPETAKVIHRYIERLPYEPNLLFAPPPLQPE